jgi:hypothetical protein
MGPSFLGFWTDCLRQQMTRLLIEVTVGLCPSGTLALNVGN